MARARILAHHTYARRAALVDSVLKGATPVVAEAGR
jgi:hypothetical protein